MNSISIFQVSSTNDWRQAQALLLDYFEWVRAATGMNSLEEKTGIKAEIDGLAERYSGQDSALFIAYDDLVPVGTIAICAHLDRSAELKRLYVRPVARGRGLARKLLCQALEAAVQRDCRSVWLESLSGLMDPAIRLYQQYGFQIISRQSRTMQVDGVIVMERDLADIPDVCTTTNRILMA